MGAGLRKLEDLSLQTRDVRDQLLRLPAVEQEMLTCLIEAD